MNCGRIASIIALALITGCADVTIVGLSGQTIQVMNDIKFKGVDRDENGMTRLTFTLTNRTNRPLCFQHFSPSKHYGQIDYFLKAGTSYFYRVAFSHWVPDINQPLSEDWWQPQSVIHEIAPNAQFEIIRIITPSVYRSYANVDMTGNTEFAGAFEGLLGLYAELEVYLNYCDINDPNEWFPTVPYLFKSGRVGPFRVSIPPVESDNP